MGTQYVKRDHHHFFTCKSTCCIIIFHRAYVSEMLLHILCMTHNNRKLTHHGIHVIILSFYSGICVGIEHKGLPLGM